MEPVTTTRKSENPARTRLTAQRTDVRQASATTVRCVKSHNARSARVELALGAEAKPVVLHAVVLDRWVSAVRCHLELHKVPEAKLPGLLKLLEGVLRRAYQAKVNVLRGARVLDTQLEHETTFERHPFPEKSANPSEGTSNTRSCRLRVNS